ncbi:MAG: hypothetical protein IH847_07980 [Acidobacteria bacterium]|nr:hypothetical protein [Acidobacteriota bacterium]
MTKTDELIIGLLGRIAFPGDELRSTITRGKKNPRAYVHGYNACNGKNTVNQIAKVVGVTPGTLVPILQQWEKRGIIYEAEAEERGKFYRCLYPLEV